MSVAHPHQGCAPVSTVWATLRNPKRLERVRGGGGLRWLPSLVLILVPYDS
jgi:hypothetical protein